MVILIQHILTAFKKNVTFFSPCSLRGTWCSFRPPAAGPHWGCHCSVTMSDAVGTDGSAVAASTSSWIKVGKRFQHFLRKWAGSPQPIRARGCSRFWTLTRTMWRRDLSGMWEPARQLVPSNHCFWSRSDLFTAVESTTSPFTLVQASCLFSLLIPSVIWSFFFFFFQLTIKSRHFFIFEIHSKSNDIFSCFFFFFFRGMLKNKKTSDTLSHMALAVLNFWRRWLFVLFSGSHVLNLEGFFWFCFFGFCFFFQTHFLCFRWSSNMKGSVILVKTCERFIRVQCEEIKHFPFAIQSSLTSSCTCNVNASKNVRWNSWSHTCSPHQIWS